MRRRRAERPLGAAVEAVVVMVAPRAGFGGSLGLACPTQMLVKHWTARLADSAVAGAFAGLSSLRGARAFHPEGRAFEGLVHVETELPALAGSALGRRGATPALVRLSRAFALPRRAGDIYGLALRLGPSPRRAPADLLLAGSLEGALGKLVPAFRRGRRGPVALSSVLPLGTRGGRRILLGAWV